MIRFDNFKEQYADLKAELDPAIHRVLDSGWFILGQELQTFEKELAHFIGCQYCVGVASGTDAIALALMALDIGQGDEVVTSDMTAFPTISGIIQSGAKPVTADICLHDGLLDIASVKKKITPRTKAIVPVHLYGQACNMEPLKQLAKEHGLKIMEDCAQSIGASYGNTTTGAIGDAAAFSFYPTKNLGAYGDAGVVTTNQEAVYEKLLHLRNYGQTKRYYHDHFGFNSRLDEIQAAILHTKLKYLKDWNKKRHEHASYYRQHLDSSKIQCLQENAYGVPVYHLFIIRSNRRDALMDYLKSKDIQSLIHYPVPIHRQKGFPGSHTLSDQDYPKAVRFADEILSIPIYPELSEESRSKIVSVINEFE